MELCQLVNQIKYPECKPLYFLDEKDYFRSSLDKRAGFSGVGKENVVEYCLYCTCLEIKDFDRFLVIKGDKK